LGPLRGVREGNRRGKAGYPLGGKTYLNFKRVCSVKKEKVRNPRNKSDVYKTLSKGGRGPLGETRKGVELWGARGNR